jgi:hypothetical protein
MVLLRTSLPSFDAAISAVLFAINIEGGWYRIGEITPAIPGYAEDWLKPHSL